jgi:mannose-6-phosphate isomerase class I
MVNVGVYTVFGDVRKYDWGGNVDQLASMVNAEQLVEAHNTVDRGEKIAEIWFNTVGGTYYYDENNTKQYIVGEKLTKTTPYVVKLLNINQPLSLQVHPLLENAEEGHRNGKEGYVDGLEKNETSFCVSEKFVTYAGFNTPLNTVRMLDDIILSTYNPKIMKTLHAMRNDVRKIAETHHGATHLERQIRAYVVKLLTTQLGVDVAKMLTSALKRKKLPTNASLELKTLQKMVKNYPNDKALSVLPLLHVEQLEFGEKIHIPAGTPHAYVEGQILEICTLSDNTLRAGLTTKTTHVDDFVENLTINFNYVKPLHYTQPINLYGDRKHSPTEQYSVEYLHGTSSKTTLDFTNNTGFIYHLGKNTIIVGEEKLKTPEHTMHFVYNVNDVTVEGASIIVYNENQKG